MLPFAPSVTGSFVWDDRALIAQSPVTASVLPVGRFFARDFWASGGAPRQSGYYRPLTLLSYALERRLFGLRPLPMHVTNLLLHAGSTLAGYLLLRNLGASWREGVLTSLLFAWHPVHAESVAWISGRTDLLAALCALGALLAALTEGGWPLAGLLFLASLLAKESCVLLPLVAIHPRFATRRARLSGALLAGGGSYAVLRLWALGPPRLAGTPILARAASAGTLVFAYLGKLLWPARLPLDFEVSSSEAVGIPLALVVLAALLLCLFAAFRGFTSGTALLLFLLPLMPTLGIVPIADRSALRFLYLPTLGVAWLLVHALLRSHRRAGTIALGTIAVVLSLLSFRRSLDFRDDVALFTAERTLSPASVRMALDLGDSLRRDGRPREAITVYEQMRRQGTRSLALDLALERAYRDGGDLERAAEVAKATLSDFGDDARAHAEAGLTYGSQGFPSLAQAELARALEIDPGSVMARVNLAMHLARSHQLDEARSILDEGLRRDPKSAELTRARGLLGTPDTPP